jgi:peptidoglycan hydrolase-like protein with peptidoglycan-binding domain
VLELQKLLNRTQNAGINETGYFGSVTKNAVKNFQYKYGINPVSGIAWTKTNFVLNKIDCGGSINVVNNDKYLSTKSNLNYINLNINNKTFKNKAIPTQAKVMYDKSGNVVTDATGAPTLINFGTSVNINSNINKIVAEASKTLNATTSTTTVKIQKQSIWQKIQNSFSNFWAKYKANFQK